MAITGNMTVWCDAPDRNSALAEMLYLTGQSLLSFWRTS
ncbi:hypothetical protein Z945_3879 [Sulfitobacter noctilucae]|nr:hypothetical protein Z945_3879 [Sulfitobacter noctilucae]